MKWRFLGVLLFFLFSFLGIWGRLFYWQIVKADELSAAGQAQYSQHIEIVPKRGEILAADGFPLATNKLTYLLYANPKLIKDPKSLSQSLGDIFKSDPASYSAQLHLPDRVWVPLQQNIPQDIKEKVEKMNLPGIGFEETPTRFYPEASMAAQLLGFVGKDDQGENKGYFGIEGYYDRQLRGRIGQVTVVRDAFGRPIFSKLNGNSGQQDGRSVKLHIDRTIQFLLEEKLRNGLQQYGAESGMAAVMDPKTGNILAMASFPSFDERSYWDYDASLYKNPLITNVYEPGSTLKPLIMAAALDKGRVKPETTCPICGAPVQIGDYAIHTWNNEYTDHLNMIDTIIHSDNTGMVYVSKLLGFDTMMSYLHKFGIGSMTNIDLQGEFAPGLTEQKKVWYPVDVATVSFGQGIDVTPIELLDGFSAIANSGVRMEPHIVASIQTSDGKTISIPPKQLDQPISDRTAKVMTEILVETVNKGEANFARLKGYRIAGKTGTASIAKDGRYDPNQTIASFIGFAPADNPKFSMLVIVNKPTSSIYGAETAAPIFFDIARDILAHYNIAPTEDQ
jgi:cell division protein FtsI/penicillin-binding protein 2